MTRHPRIRDLKNAIRNLPDDMPILTKDNLGQVPLFPFFRATYTDAEFQYGVTEPIPENTEIFMIMGLI